MGKLLGSLDKPLMSMKGPLGKIFDTAVKGAGGGVAANVIDKELLGSRLKNLKITLPTSFTSALGPTVVTANATDLGMFLAVNGLKIPTGKNLMVVAGLWLVKKVAEARGWIIDDPIHTNRTTRNVTERREQEMHMLPQPSMYGGSIHS